jgi:hypothetical protein
VKPLQRFYRPYFSPNLNSYEIDYTFGGAGLDPEYTGNDDVEETKKLYYLSCININSKYLFMIPLDLGNKGGNEETRDCIEKIKESIEKMTPGATIRYIRGDADRKFGTIALQQTVEKYDTGLLNDKYTYLGHFLYKVNPFTKFCRDNHIELFLVPSPYTNKNRVVDRATRTIRDILGENRYALFDTNVVKAAVERYNNSPHIAFNNEFTPKEVQMNPDLEAYYIRQQMLILNDVKDLQIEEGFFNYQRGDVLLIHLSETKTEKKMDRKRRQFNRLAEFMDYENGNVKCCLLIRHAGVIVSDKSKPIVIPIFYTRYVAPSIKNLPREYHQLVF